MTKIVPYPWRPGLSVFGPIKVPFATVEIQNSDNEWEEFVMKIDSGAIVTLMNPEDCTLLGYTLNVDNEVTFKDAQDNNLPTCVLRLNMRFGDIILSDVPVAFAKRRVPDLLLGRIKIFDYFDISLLGRIGLSTFRQE
jgi:hypothetical protein